MIQVNHSFTHSTIETRGGHVHSHGNGNGNANVNVNGNVVVIFVESLRVNVMSVGM